MVLLDFSKVWLQSLSKKARCGKVISNVLINITTKECYNHGSKFIWLCKSIRTSFKRSEEYKAIKEAFANVKANEESKKLFDEFRETQINFQQKQMQGEEIAEEDLQKAQEQAQAIEKDENISALMNAEQKMSQVFQEINQIIVKPLDEIYAD